MAALPTPPFVPVTMDWVRSTESLFDLLPDVYFFAKNLDGKFIAVNQGFAARTKHENKRSLLGLTDFDLWPSHMSEKYVKDDQYVVETGQSLLNVVELAINQNNSTDWLATTKVPIFDLNGGIVGVAGYCRDLRKADAQNPLMRMGEVFDHVMKNFSRSIDISELAALTYLSVSQFERRFKSMFKITPMKYVSLVRINAACEALAEGKERISEISYQNGFYDLSHFNRQFKKTMGMAPSVFRRKYFQASDYPRIPGLQIQKTWGKPPEGYLPSRK